MFNSRLTIFCYDRVMAKSSSNEIQSVPEKVAIAATGVAITAGIVALGAAMMTDEKTRNKLIDNARKMMVGVRKLAGTVSEEGQKTYKAIRTLRPE